MDIAQLTQRLDSFGHAEPWLRRLGVEDPRRAHACLAAIAHCGVTLDLLAGMCVQLERLLPETSDPDRALLNLERYFQASRSPLSVATLFERDVDSLRILLQISAASQHLGDVLVRDPESLDLLRMTDGRPVARELLVDEIRSDASTVGDDASMGALLRRCKQRETLRIAAGDILHKQPVHVVSRQISHLADAICEAAIAYSRRKLARQWGDLRRPDGSPARFVAVALGKLGGVELNYSSDIDLILLCDGDGRVASSRTLGSVEYFGRLAKLFVRLLAEKTDRGGAYRVDLRLRPSGAQGPLVMPADAALRYYDVSGRTWERQAFVKARSAAGDHSLGAWFLSQMTPWIYRRYLSRADISGIKALKRKIERRAAEAGGRQDLKQGRGGIRDIEFVIQFLQLLNGAELPQLRIGNTLEAIARLQETGCLTLQEATILAENYAFLREAEHRLQILFDLQTHSLPADERELRRLAIRMGIDDSQGTAREQFRQRLERVTELNQKILNHLLHDAFGDEEAAPETDLILDPSPGRLVEAVLEPHGFRDPQEAYRNLMALGEERIPFLSTRRCRHFLSSIAPRLLPAIADTPDPDGTLVNLNRVSDSLGGKGVLWELFSFNPATLQLYVRLCASSDYLSSILVSHPGMIDELMDSLVVERLPRRETLRQSLDELCRGAEDIDPILNNFKNAQHLRVGVRDVLGKSDIRDSHHALADVAEAIVRKVAEFEWRRLEEKFGPPTLDDGAPCAGVVLALGKLGGREPNYHSDLDIVFLYSGGGKTAPLRRRAEGTTNHHFFSQWAQRLIKRLTNNGPTGRLYEIDARLRPTGRNGALAVSLPEFARYFSEGAGEFWERMALCKARVICGPGPAAGDAMRAVRDALFAHPWAGEQNEQLAALRCRLEQGAAPRNLKRGPGGAMDVEWVVQALQLRHGRKLPGIVVPGTLDAIEALRGAGLIESGDADSLRDSYRLLRSVEARIRLMKLSGRHDLPADPLEMEKLAYLLEMPSAAHLERLCRDAMDGNRERFTRLVGRVTLA